jgi:hypothetical protein
VRVESDLLPAERRFTSSSPNVHGTLFDGGDGRMALMLAAEKADAASITLALPGAKIVASDGKNVPVNDGKFDAGSFAPWQVKTFEISAGKAGDR